jgi:hypothetical protein
MRRLTHHLFTICSAMLLLLCMAVYVLWVRSGHNENRRSCLIGRDRSAPTT